MVNVNCERVWREISNYLEGEVEATLRTAMDEHLRSCTKCASVLAGMRNVIDLYGDERMIEIPAGYGRRLEKRLAQSARVGGSRWSTWSAWLVPVAALALIAGGLRFANSLSVGEPLKSEHAQPAHDIPPDMMVVVSADAKLSTHPVATPSTTRTKSGRSPLKRPCAKDTYPACGASGSTYIRRKQDIRS